MKLLYLLKDNKAIDTLLNALKLLHGNNCETLFSFTPSGLALSQSWYEKSSEKGKYFFYLEHTHFAKISCKETNFHLEVNIKNIIQKLKSYHKDLIEVSISVYSLENEEETEEPWCTLEFYMVLKNLNSVIYRNTCRVMKNNREFIPLIYFKHIYDTKKLLMCGKAAKVSFLASWKNNFIRLLLKKDKVNFICDVTDQSIEIDPIAFFDIFNYDAFATVYENVHEMILPPNHLLRYLKLCQKLKTFFNVYFTTSLKEGNRVKFYCPLRIDQGIFVLKFSATYFVSSASYSIAPKFITSTLESRTEPAILQPTTQDVLIPKTTRRIIDSSNKKPPPRPFIKKIELSNSLPDSENQMIGTTAGSNFKRKNPFKFSQDTGQKSVRQNNHKVAEAAMTSASRALIPQDFIFASESFQSRSVRKNYAFNFREEEEEDKKDNHDAMEIEAEGSRSGSASIKFEPGVNGNPKSVRIRGSELSLDKVTFRKSYRINTTQAPRKMSLQPFRPEPSGIFYQKRNSLFKILPDGDSGVKRMLFAPGEAENCNKEFSKKMTTAIRAMQL